MDLFQLMTQGEDPRDKVLDRLEGIVALYESEDEAVQDEALARSISLCGKEWGSYAAGLEELALRKENRAAEPLGGEMEALRLRQEAEEPGALIRAARIRRSEKSKLEGERAAIVARYGSLEAAMAPSPVEQMFVAAAAHLAEPDEAADPWSPLAGWSLAWHAVPAALVEAVTLACPLPDSVTDARAEALAWDERRHEREILSDGAGTAALPTACTARHNLVVEAWARALPARSLTELEARLDYWAKRGGDDGAGYGVALADLNRLLADGTFQRATDSTKDKARRLKADNPGWSLARIGLELGISRQAVHKHLRGA